MSLNEPSWSGSVSPPPPGTEGNDWRTAYTPEGTSDYGQGDSTTQVAKQEASNVAHSASGAAQHVASATKDQVASVAADAKSQTKQLAGQAGQELSEQVSTGKDHAVSSLHSLSQELRGMAERSEESGPATELARKASSATDQIASFLEQRDPKQILDEVRHFARRRPGTFLLGAALAGVVVGRLTRGALSSASTSPSAGDDHGHSGGNGASTYGSAEVPIPPSSLPAAPVGDSGYYGHPAPTPYPHPYPRTDQGPGSVSP